jgi:hypothetical protein
MREENAASLSLSSMLFQKQYCFLCTSYKTQHIVGFGLISDSFVSYRARHTMVQVALWHISFVSVYIGRCIVSVDSRVVLLTDGLSSLLSASGLTLSC